MEKNKTKHPHENILMISFLMIFLFFVGDQPSVQKLNIYI